MKFYKNGFKDVANSGRVFKSRDRALILRNALAPGECSALDAQRLFMCLLF